MTERARRVIPPRRQRARKRFGQHFLERAWVEKVVAAIGPAPQDVFLEIGPGEGALTRPLAERARRVLAVEIDRDLAGQLRQWAPAHLAIVQADVLTLEASTIIQALGANDPAAPIRVAGNLPYNVAAPIIFRLLHLYETGLRVMDAVVMVQREVADRMLAVPGTRDYGVLAVLLRHVAEITRLLDLPAGAFRPVPQVRSTLVRLRFHEPRPPTRDLPGMRRLVRSLFARRRKTLATALCAATGLPRATALDVLARTKVAGTQRPETLEVAELVELSNVLYETREPTLLGDAG